MTDEGRFFVHRHSPFAVAQGYCEEHLREAQCVFRPS